MNFEEILRKLARSDYWQMLFAKAENMNGIRLFKNQMDFSWIQITFLMWLQIYSNLYQELAIGTDYLTKSVIIDDMRCDAFLLYRKRTKDLKDKKKMNPSKSDSVVFK